MTKFLKISLLFLLFSQLHQYNFDYCVTYEIINSKNQNKNRTVSYFINKQDNSYFALQNNTLNKLKEITFLDRNGVYFKSQLEIKTLINSSITLNKEHIKKYSNPYKFQVDNYDFVKLKDTILNNKVCKRFLLKHNNPKRETKRQIGKEVYVIDTTFNIKPMLTFDTAYEIWKLRKNIPDGLIVEKYLYNSKNELEITEKIKSNENISMNFKL